MSSRAQSIKAGIFILAGLVLTVVIFGLIAGRRRQPFDPYYIVFRESVRGLEKDSVVLYQGAAVGKVLDVRVTDENQVLVEIGIDKNRLRPRQGIHATLNFSSIFRGLQIDLGGGDPDMPLLPPRSFISARPSVIEDITKDLPGILMDIKNILAKIDGALEEVGRPRLQQVVETTGEVMDVTRGTLEELTLFLRAARESLTVTEEEVTRAMDEVAETLRPLRRTLDSVAEDPSIILRGPGRHRDAYVR